MEGPSRTLLSCLQLLWLPSTPADQVTSTRGNHDKKIMSQNKPFILINHFSRVFHYSKRKLTKREIKQKKGPKERQDFMSISMVSTMSVKCPSLPMGLPETAGSVSWRTLYVAVVLLHGLMSSSCDGDMQVSGRHLGLLSSHLPRMVLICTDQALLHRPACE